MTNVTSISSWFSLTAFVVGSGVTIVRYVLASRERRIKLARPSDRLAMAEAFSRRFRVLGRPIETDGLTEEHKYSIIMTQFRAQMHRCYVAAVTCILFAVCAAGVAYAFSHPGDVITPPDQAKMRNAAMRVLQACYARDYKTVYDGLASQLKPQITFGNLAMELDREFGQFSTKGPLNRRLEDERLMTGGYWVVKFQADFDSVSSFREVVTFAKSGPLWEVYRVDVMPAVWQQVPTARFLPAAATEITKALHGLTGEKARDVVDKQFKGFYTPTPGWNLIADRSEHKVADQTCDVSSHEPNTGTPVVLRGVLGGCQIQKGERLGVLAMLSDATEHQIELDAVRILK